MQDRFFGDSNDYRKYGLLRLMAGGQPGPIGLRIGLLWMSWRFSGKTDYLNDSSFAPPDPALYAALKQEHSLYRIENSPANSRLLYLQQQQLIPQAHYFNREIKPRVKEKPTEGVRTYFRKAVDWFADGPRDLLYLDPDAGLNHGLAVQRLPNEKRSLIQPLEGHKPRFAVTHVEWSELGYLYQHGYSVMVPQPYPVGLYKNSRERFTQRLVEKARAALPEVDSYRCFLTPEVVYLLAVHPAHQPTLTRLNLAEALQPWGESLRQFPLDGTS